MRSLSADGGAARAAWRRGPSVGIGATVDDRLDLDAEPAFGHRRRPMRTLLTTSVLLSLVLVACASASDAPEALGSASSAFTPVPTTAFPPWTSIQGPNGECLTAWSTSDTSLHTRACNGNDPLQYFQFTPDPNFASWTAIDWMRGWNNGCADQVGNTGAFGSVALDACQTSANAEGWQWDNGLLRNSGQDLCLVVPSSRNITHAVSVNTCEPGYASYVWRTLSVAAQVPKYAFLGMKNRCLDHGPYQPYGAGLPLVTWDCNGGLAQMFQWNPFNAGEIKDLATGMCLDTLWQNANGMTVVEMPCNGSASQAWTIGNGQVVSNWNNKCLEVRGWSESNGTDVELWDCWGGLLQHWDHVQ
jgi:Ricin-type beta-trefoil lectin domain